MIFAKRYESLLFHGENHEMRDDICGVIDYRIRQRLVSLMQTFSQPIMVYYDRYDKSKYEESDALTLACQKFDEIMQAPYIYVPYGMTKASYNLSAQCFAFILSVIELQYEYLDETYKFERTEMYDSYSEDLFNSCESSNEKQEFMKSINSFMTENDLPWCMHDGKMIKIDAQQFECDLRGKTLETMKELKDTSPIFQSAYTELTSAIEALEKGEFQNAISDAGKSYESVLKVILGVDNGNAGKLTQNYRDKLLNVPATMKAEGFEKSVMSSLPYIRNNSGADHGAGAKEVVISKPMAKLAVNLAASLDTYLIEEYADRMADTEC